MHDGQRRLLNDAAPTPVEHLDYEGVPALIAGYNPKWRSVPSTRALLPPSPETGPAPKWGRPTHVFAGQRYQTGELCDGSRPSRTIVVKIIAYNYPRGRWECVVVRSDLKSKRRAGDHVFRLSRDLKKLTTKGTPIP